MFRTRVVLALAALLGISGTVATACGADSSEPTGNDASIGSGGEDATVNDAPSGDASAAPFDATADALLDGSSMDADAGDAGDSAPSCFGIGTACDFGAPTKQCCGGLSCNVADNSGDRSCCVPFGHGCSVNSDCCLGAQNSSQIACGPSKTCCGTSQSTCTTDSQCCTGACDGGCVATAGDGGCTAHFCK